MSCFPCEPSTSDEEYIIDVSSVLGNPPTIKILLLGEDKVGKSSLIQRLIHDKFSDDYNANARTFYEKEVIVDTKCVNLNIYDSIAHDFISMQHPMIQEADVFLLIYAINSKSSFDEIELIRKRLLRCRENIDNGSVPFVVIGNKCDLEQSRQIHREQGASYCRMLNVPFFETSAKKQINDKQCFYECFRHFLVVKSDLLRDKELDRRRREMKLNKKSKLERCGMMMQCKKDREMQDDEGKYIVRNKNKIDENMIKKLEDETMDINIAIVGTHNVGKHSMIHSFIDEFGKSDKKDTYFTSIKTKENIANIENKLGYKQRLELILNVYCIEYHATDLKKKGKYNKCILTPSSCKSRRTSIDIEDNDKYIASPYDDLMCDGFDFNSWHACDKQLNIRDIAQKNAAFLFVVSMDDKQSFVQCQDIMASIKNDDDYNYRKPILIVVTKYDLARNKHRVTECDIAEFAVDIGCPYVIDGADAFHRVISLIRGYLSPSPSKWIKVADLEQHQGSVCVLTQSLDGKYLFSGGADASIRVWDIETSICIAILAYHSDTIYAIEEHCITLARQWWKPCRYLISCSADASCCVWMIFNNESSNSSFYGVVDAQQVLNNDNIPLFLNSPRFVFKHDARIKSFVICNNNILCTVGDDSRMKLWSLIDGKLLYDSGDCDDVFNCVVFVKECNKIYAASRDESVYVWDISRALSCGKRGTKLSGGHHDSVNYLRVCCKNNKKNKVYLLSMDESGYIRCRDARSPHKIYWDYIRHSARIQSAVICAINDSSAYDCMLCTTSADGTVRGYSIPDGEIIFNICESSALISAIDCNQQQFIVSAGYDEYVRCYELYSSDIKYASVDNNLSIALKWAQKRHSSHLNDVLCGKKQFKHMVFSCDEDGIILGWNMNSGECCACFGNDESRNLMIRNPSRKTCAEFVTIFVQFLQLMSLTFAIDIVDWGHFNAKYSPFALCSKILQFDLEFYNYEWFCCILCTSIFLILFFTKYRFEFCAKKIKARFSKYLQFFCWLSIRVGFLPILRHLFGVFCCKSHLAIYLKGGAQDCWSPKSIQFWMYILMSSATLIVFVPIAYRFESRSCDLQQVNCYYWFIWNKDYPQFARVNAASHRSNLFALIEKTTIIFMCAISVFLDRQLLIVTLLIAASLALCASSLLFPRFYWHKTNIFHSCLLFAVLWTNVWSLFVISSSRISLLSEWRQPEIDKFVTVVHLTLLLPFMLFGGLLMFIRTHKHFYDEIRGDFRSKLYEKRIGFLSQQQEEEIGANEKNESDVESAAIYGMRDNLFFIYKKQKKLEHLKQSEDEKEDDIFPPPLILSHSPQIAQKVQSSFSLIPLCENGRNHDEKEEEEEILLSDPDDDIMTVIQHLTDRELESSIESAQSNLTNHAHVPQMDSKKRIIDCDNLGENANVAKREQKRKKIYGSLLKSPNNKKQKRQQKSAHFDYYARVDRVAAVPFPIAAVSSNRSDVTAFSGIGDVPENIGHHLFDQFP